MNENCIEFLRNAETATVTFCQGRYITRIKELAEKFPEECKIIAENPDGSILAHIPTKWIHITNYSRELSDEERQAAADRFRNLVRQGRIKPKTAENPSEDS